MIQSDRPVENATVLPEVMSGTNRRLDALVGNAVKDNGGPREGSPRGLGRILGSTELTARLCLGPKEGCHVM